MKPQALGQSIHLTAERSSPSRKPDFRHSKSSEALSYLTSFVFGAFVTIRATHEGLPGEGMEEQLWLSR